jgi:tellurite resistance protein TehA-like permease
MGPGAPTRPGLSVRSLPPNIFAVVMATGIVSLAVNGAGFALLAHALFWLNVGLYAVLWVLLISRVLRHRADLAADLRSHAKAPGFFTLVAAPCVLGNQCVLLFGGSAAGLALWVVGVMFWLALTYAMVPGLMEGVAKPKPEEGLNGAWLLAVVGTQAVSVLACLLVPALADGAPDLPLFVALAFWLVGSMLYIWLIALIFHRILFLPLPPGELTPPYWINMGAMAISTLAGVRLVGEASRMPLLAELLPFLKGMTLLFWATGTWWIPILVALGVWRHLYKRVPLSYEHGYWAAVFPLGMYTVCTQNLIRVFQLPFLQLIAAAFVWIALLAWGLTFVGMAWHVIAPKTAGTMRTPPGDQDKGTETQAALAGLGSEPLECTTHLSTDQRQSTTGK